MHLIVDVCQMYVNDCVIVCSVECLVAGTRVGAEMIQWTPVEKHWMDNVHMLHEPSHLSQVWNRRHIMETEWGNTCSGAAQFKPTQTGLGVSEWCNPSKKLGLLHSGSKPFIMSPFLCTINSAEVTSIFRVF